MAIKKNQVVSLHYTLKNDAGDIIDSSAENEPLGFIYGIGMVISGLEKELASKNKGDQFQVTIPPEDAYGTVQDERIQSIALSHFEDPQNIKEGLTIQIENNETGQDILATVTEVKDEMVTINMNHPLAGLTLHFDVEVVDVRDATEEEINSGNIQGVGGFTQ